ncbi:hypothetical protein [Acidocella sp.]|uniref:hypothetical protein n=1 Tax=Acidocella sp. TaxID=50710 RepID=UPI00262F5CC3|nr:hypothetical protein [Acidocella sp.]
MLIARARQPCQSVERENIFRVQPQGQLKRPGRGGLVANRLVFGANLYLDPASLGQQRRHFQKGRQRRLMFPTRARRMGLGVKDAPRRVSAHVIAGQTEFIRY